MQIIRRFDKEGISLDELVKSLMVKSIEEIIDDYLFTNEGMLGGKSDEDSKNELEG